MGGSAFSAFLSAAAFPRLPPAVYKSVKARYLPRLESLYALTTVPLETPEKLDHGDLDILVAIPKQPYTLSLPHEIIRSTLGAEHVIPMDGNRTSNYAIPIKPSEWKEFGLELYEEERRRATDDGKIYYQVDVHVCEDKEEWNRISFFHSYGDLGMILGLIARNNGMHLGAKGLKLPDPPNPPFHLSDSFNEIAEFLGLSLTRYEEGFTTKRQIFEWAATTRFFDAKNFRSKGPGISKVKAERTMYSEFVEWVEETKPRSNANPYCDMLSAERTSKVREDALAFFKKKDEFNDRQKARSNKNIVKDGFSGHRVRDWTDLGEHWRGVKMIMDEVRRRMGGEEAIAEFVTKNDLEDLKAIVLKVQSDLGVWRNDRREEDPAQALAKTLETASIKL